MNTLPDGLTIATLDDFVSIDKDKNWTWRVGLQYCLLNATNQYEMYVIDERWNDRKIYDPDVEKPDKRTMFVEVKGVGMVKGNLLCQFIDAGLCFIDKKDKYVKPLSKAEFKKKIVSDKTDF